MQDHDNDIERRKFPAIAMGLTALCIGLVLISAMLTYCRPADRAEPFELIKEQSR